MLMNMKMPTLVGIFIFISTENFMLRGADHKKCFITSEPGLLRQFCALLQHLFFWGILSSPKILAAYFDVMDSISE